MKISVRDKDNDLLKPLEIITLKGEDGITPNIQIGTVNTVPPDQEASIIKRGTKEEPIFDFNIPRGASSGSNSWDGQVTTENIVDHAVGVRQTSFLETGLQEDYFRNSNVLIGKKIVPGDSYSITTDELYIISDHIPLQNTIIPIDIYKYGRIAFFNGETFIGGMGLYTDNSTDIRIDINNYPVLANAKSIKVCINKEDLNNMYVKQGEVILNSINEIYFKDLLLTSKQTKQIVEKIPNNSVPFSVLKEVKSEKVTEIEIKDGYKIAGNGDIGYDTGSFSLVTKNDASTTGFISINVNTNSIWELKNVDRLSFFTENETYIDSLYDKWSISSAAHPPTSPIKIFEQFPSLRNAKKVRISIRTSNKFNCSLKIDGVEYLKLVSTSNNYYIEGLIIKDNNLSENIKTKLDKLDDKDNSFKNHKDTTIVFKKNIDFSSTHFRIPFMCVTNLGTIIAGCDIRYKSWNDHSLIDIGTARSEDGGKTWIDKTVAIPNPGINNTLSRTMDGTILATKEGRVFLIGNKFDTGSTGWTNITTPNDPNWDCVMYRSDDDGRTWQFHQSLKSLLPQGQISFLGGVGSGIQMKNGTLVFPIQMAMYNDRPFNCQSGIIYSTDNGDTWRMGETLIPEYTSECSIVEYPTGTIIINCRQEGQNHRSVFKTTNLGTTWEETPMNTGTQQTNACQGHMCKIKVGFNKEVILFTNPINDGTNREDGAKPNYDRSNLSLSILQNDSKFTPIYTLYRPHSDGYSCMAFDERRNRLYIVMELEYNLVFKDITDLLPTIQLYKNLEVKNNI